MAVTTSTDNTASKDTMRVADSVANTMIGNASADKSGKSSAAHWGEILVPASFCEIEFPTTQVKISSGRKLVKHVFPYRDAQEVIDLGRQPLTVTMSAVFTNEEKMVERFKNDDQGALYPGRYQKLISAIHTGKPGVLVHPVFGAMNARCESYSDTTQATELNTVRLELTFVEDWPNNLASHGTLSPTEDLTSGAAALDAMEK